MFNKQLHKILKKLEKHYKDMQDVEFTVENKNYGCFKLDQEKEQLNQQ
jgi:coproporphyrinogen III oxidase-like Fe-S oxidoreductase